MKGIILCGGSGTRLWPISRTLYPKQFVKLFDDKSLFQLTVERNADLCRSFLIVSNAEQYFLAIDQLEELNIHSFNANNSRFLLESVGRNTAGTSHCPCMSIS
jgi:mannose-1-phosphate guanylyltransferase